MISAAGYMTVGLVSRWKERERYRQDCPEYFFEDGDDEQQSLTDSIKKATGVQPIYCPKEDEPQKGIQAFTPLQAADILAWNEHSNLRDQVLKGSSSVSPYFRALREDRPMMLGFYTDAQMKKMFDDGEEYERKHGRRIYAVPKWKSFAPR